MKKFITRKPHRKKVLKSEQEAVAT
jgi:hypothetical protein